MYKLTILSLALIAGAVADDFRPQGALLVFPSQFQQQQQESLEKVSEAVMERLRQEQGSQTGNYHVYLPDGRLQKVQFTAAPVSQSGSYRQYPASSSSSQVNVQNSQSAVNSNTFQYNQQNANRYSRPQFQEQRQQFEQQRQEFEQQQQKDFSGKYVATVQFSDVQPIPAPIYSNSPAPLTRILRHLH